MPEGYSIIGELHPVRLSVFDGKFGKEPIGSLEYSSLEALGRKFRQPQVVADKGDAFLYARCTALGGREREDLLPPFLVILDVDGSPVSMKACSRALGRLGVGHFAHSTWSHDPDDPLDLHRYRVVTDILAEDWRTVTGITRELAAAAGVEVDACSSHQIGFFVPCTDGERVVKWTGKAGRTSWKPDPSTWDDLGDDHDRAAAMEAPDRDPETIDPDELREALAAIPNDERGQWVRTGQCLHGSGLEDARALWDWWSMGQDYGDFSDTEQDRVWGSFRKGGLGAASIFYDAREAGWRPERDHESAADQFAPWEGEDGEDPSPSKRALLRALSERYAFLRVGQGKVWDRELGALVSKSAFLDANINPTFPSGKYRGDEPILESIGSTWWGWDERPTYNGIDFVPPGGLGLRPDVMNLWRGWGADPAKGTPEELREGCGRFLDHVHEVVCRCDDAAYDWVVAWMAHLVQRPWEKPGTAIVMRSGEGTGKGFFARALVDLCGSHGFHAEQPGQLTGRFTQHLADKIMIFADEVTWGGRRQEEGILKGLITEPAMVVEAKGIDAYQARSYCRLAIASNEDWVIPAGPSARRFMVFDVSESRQGDKRYFARLAAELAGGGLAALHGYLRTVDLSTSPDPRDVIATAALLAQKMQGLGLVEAWVHEHLDERSINAHAPWEGESFAIPTRELYQSVLDDARDHGVQRRPSRQSVTEQLRKVLGIESVRHKTRVTVDEVDGSTERLQALVLPGVGEARAAFERYMGHAVPWSDGE